MFRPGFLYPSRRDSLEPDFPLSPWDITMARSFDILVQEEIDRSRLQRYRSVWNAGPRQSPPPPQFPFAAADWRNVSREGRWNVDAVADGFRRTPGAGRPVGVVGDRRGAHVNRTVVASSPDANNDDEGESALESEVEDDESDVAAPPTTNWHHALDAICGPPLLETDSVADRVRMLFQELDLARGAVSHPSSPPANIPSAWEASSASDSGSDSSSLSDQPYRSSSFPASCPRDIPGAGGEDERTERHYGWRLSLEQRESLTNGRVYRPDEGMHDYVRADGSSGQARDGEVPRGAAEVDDTEMWEEVQFEVW